MKKLMALIVAGFLTTFAIQASAQNELPKAGEAMQQDEEVQYKKTTEFIFEPDSIDAETLKPTGLDQTGEVDEKTSSLIEVRRDFVGELVRSVDDI